MLVVIDQSGSSPGRPGFKMAVSSDGKLSGSVGGGLSEFSVVEKAREELKSEKQTIFLRREVHQKDAEKNKSGMICSGEQWIAYYPISRQNQELIETIERTTNAGTKGMIHFNQNGISFHKDETNKHSHKNKVTSDTEWELADPIGKENEIYIFGAGHVGLALSQIMNFLDFTIHIFDDREDLNTLTDNKYADFTKIVDYKSISKFVPDGENIFVVIMTFGHKSDEIILRQLLPKKLKYLGMMGSSKKVANIYKNLYADGISADKLKKVDAPIGLPIGSQTPAEIAVSISAKIIEVKNKAG